MRVDYILYGVVFVTFAILLNHKLIQAKKAKIQSSIIEGLKQIAESMKSGNSFETAVKVQADMKQFPSSAFFGSVLKKTTEGKSTEDALSEAADESKDEIISYIAEVISLTLTSKGNIIASLNSLSSKLWEINHIQKRIDQKASAALATLQVMGIVIVPAIFYFLAGVLSTETAPIVIDMAMKSYLGAIMVIFSFLDYFIFKNIKETLFVLPAGISVYLVYLFILGPMIGNFFIA